MAFARVVVVVGDARAIDDERIHAFVVAVDPNRSRARAFDGSMSRRRVAARRADAWSLSLFPRPPRDARVGCTRTTARPARSLGLGRPCARRTTPAPRFLFNTRRLVSSSTISSGRRNASRTASCSSAPPSCFRYATTVTTPPNLAHSNAAETARSVVFAIRSSSFRRRS